MKKTFRTIAALLIVQASLIWVAACNGGTDPAKDATIQNLTSKARLYENKMKAGNEAKKAEANLITVLQQRARAYEKQNDPEAARQDYEKILDIRPGHTDARFNMGRLLIKTGQTERGVELLDEIVHKNPKYSPELYDLLAEAYKSLGETEKARKALLKSITLKPINPEAYRELANLDEKTGNKEEAGKARQKLSHLEKYGYPDRGHREKSLKEWRSYIMSGKASDKEGEGPSLPLALYNAATYYDHQVKPGDYQSYRKAMKNWQKYLAASKKTESEKGHRKTAKKRFSHLKHEKKGLLRKHHLLAPEEVWGSCAKILRRIKIMGIYLPRLKAKALEQGNQQAAREADKAIKKMQIMEIGPHEKQLEEIIDECQSIIMAELSEEVDMDDTEITRKAVKLSEKAKKIESQLNEQGFDEIEAKMKGLAAELNVNIPKYYFEEVHGEK